MANMTRREFVKLLPTLPLLRVSWPQLDDRSMQKAAGDTQPNILFLVFDTLSAKHMSLHGYPRQTTPNLARLAERATVFHHHRATGNFTTPGTASLLTGVYPWSHRAFNLHGVITDEWRDRNIFNLLPDSYFKTAYTHNLLVFSLLHQFQGAIDYLKKTRELCLRDDEYADQLFFDDYNVAFFSETALLQGQNNPSSLFLSVADRVRRFADKSRVISEYGQQFPRGIPELHNLSFVLEDAVAWIDQQISNWAQPFFAYFHFLPPHEPYATRRDFVDVFADGWRPDEKPKLFFPEGHEQPFLNRQRRDYDEYLAYADAEFGRLYDALERRGILDNTYLILTSDHGELFERGIRGHVTKTLYDPLLHVPLLIAKPGQRQREDVLDRTSAVDILPTLLHLTGQPIPNWTEGRLLPTFESVGSQPERALYALEAKANPAHAALTIGTISMVREQYKLVHYFGYKERPDDYELYDLAADPEEMSDIFDTKRSTANELKELMGQHRLQINEPFRR